MNRDVCGVCWGAYDDRGHCECEVKPPEPVAWIEWDDERNRVSAGAYPLRFEDEMYELVDGFSFKPLYTAPPRCPNCASLQAQNTELDRKLGEIEQRTLTDEVIADLWHANGGFHHHFARAVERWLKGDHA